MKYIYPFSLILRFHFFASIVLLSSCSIWEIRDESNIVENIIRISGTVEVTSSSKGDLYAVLLGDEGGIVRWVNEFKTGKDGRYTFYTMPGKYLIGVYIDENGDKKYQHGEPASYVGYDQGSPVVYELTSREEIKVPLLIVDGPLKHKPRRLVEYGLNKAIINIGARVSIDDPIFSDEFASMGMWKPVEFVKQVGGGLFLLGEYQKEKIPLIFVHGIMGSPTNFREIIESVDKSKFQPWVLYYPSGARLDMISGFFLKGLNQLQSQYKFSKFYVIAHSMGGLVTRSFVKKYQDSGSEACLAFVMTINSPIGGMRSARSGVERSPIVVPAWRDVATDSKFIKGLETWSWPSSISYHLVFSYERDESSDGVVSLESQIPNYLQKQAVRMYGYNASHTGVLKDKRFLDDLNSTLEKAYSKRATKK